LSGILNFQYPSTDDFIKKIRGVNNLGSYKFLSLDIENLYPSVPVDIVLDKAANMLFGKIQNLTKVHIRKLLEFCTNKVTFMFGNEFYKQKHGVAMGSPLAPILAEIYLHILESNSVKSENFPFKYYFYYRYVDDIFIIVDANLNVQEF
jgi:hypothetical protein